MLEFCWNSYQNSSATICCFKWKTKISLCYWLWQKYLQIIVSFFITTGYEDIAKIGTTFPEENIDKIFEYEHYILMKKHLLMYKYVLQDIEEGLKIILMDHDWHKPCFREIDNIFYLEFPWKRDWIQWPLEGVALYIDRGRIVCSKQAPVERDYFLHNCHPNYCIMFSD